MTCKYAQEFLESLGASAETIVNAKKVAIPPSEAIAMARKMDAIFAARGKKVVAFHPKSDKPEETILLEHLIGRSGNLRAPTAIIGKTMIVGFNADLYREALQT